MAYLEKKNNQEKLIYMQLVKSGKSAKLSSNMGKYQRTETSQSLLLFAITFAGSRKAITYYELKCLQDTLDTLNQSIPYNGRIATATDKST